VSAARRGDLLDLAILGLLHDSPLHGYELRKQLTAVLGAFRALSYGSLYPKLRALAAAGYITEDSPSVDHPMTRRARIVYRITADGKEYLDHLLSDAGPASWEDDTFGVHFALFGQTDADVRLRILEGRRNRLEERRSGLRSTLADTGERLDSYTLRLQEHGLESVDREVRWLNELIETERATSHHTEDPS
jgi:DNA-binding PadR family transcriptional regulator